LVSLENESEFENFITGNSETNEFDLLDTFPLTDDTWVKESLANGVSIANAKAAFNTNKIMTYKMKNTAAVAAATIITNYSINNVISNVNSANYMRYGGDGSNACVTNILNKYVII
jgi:hypothetical protein